MGLQMDDSFFSLEKKPRGSASLAAVISVFVPTWTTGLIFVAIFVLIRQWSPKIYYPRTYIGTVPEKHRTPAAANSYFGWVQTMYNVPDKFILYHQSMDAYLYLRFLRTIIFLCLVGCCLTWPTLMPANATGGGSSTQLDKFGIGNVKRKDHLYAHAVIAWAFFAFIMFTIARERVWLISLRHAWALSKSNSTKLSSRTVLFLSVTKDAIDERSMDRIFGKGAVRIWPAIKAAELADLVSDRDASVEQLEEAETKLIRRAGAKARKERQRNPHENADEPADASLPRSGQDGIRPRHHLGHAMTGEKVDSIQWLRNRIKKKESEVEDARNKQDEIADDSSAAVFVEFKTIAYAQEASQHVQTTKTIAPTPTFLGVTPNEIIWNNLFLTPKRRLSQESIATVIVTALIVFWSIPSSFIGLISNISYVADSVDWLAWLKNLPTPVIGLLTGLGPPLATSLLSKYVPNIFRFIFRSFGAANTAANELKVQKWFYIFQVTQVFLVTAVFSGAATVFSELLQRAKDPVSIPELLARQLPRSSNYFLTYFLIQGITTSADNLLNWTDLLQYLVMGWTFDKTPRQKFNRSISMKGIAWGKVFPKFANFAIIAIAYSCIAPLVLGVATVGLAFYYFSYRYNLLFVIQPKIDTRGQAYTLALQHLLAGVYIAELALIGLLGLADATGPLVMIVVLFLVTVLYNYLTNKYLVPLERCLPIKVVNEQVESDETAPLLRSAEEGQLSGQTSSNNHTSGKRRNLPKVLDLVVRFFNPHDFATHRAMEDWLREDDKDFQGFDEDLSNYTEDELIKAYKNPLLTSSTPIVWLPKDDAGVSRDQVAENEEAGLKSTDQGAWLDEKNKVRWNDMDFRDVPLLKAPTRY